MKNADKRSERKLSVALKSAFKALSNSILIWFNFWEVPR